jgi:type I restriction enzyme S subunit
MIEGLKPYAEYKESGLNWLGRIPVSWETPRTKTRFRLSIEKSGIDHGKELLSVYTHIGVRPRKDLEERGNKASSTNDYWLVRRGDIIVNKLLAWMGAVGVSHYDGVTSPAYDILRPIQKLEPDFYHLLFRTKMYLQLFKSRSRGIMDMRLRLYFDELGQIPLICPPPEEQAAIVRFLDHANRKIDGFIRAKRKLIGLLNEQKQAIIHRAVTRGLDPNVPLKPSNIPWLGDIPKHWDVRRLKFLAHIKTGGRDTTDRIDDGHYPFYVRSQTVERIDTFSFDGEAVLTAGDGAGVGKVFHYVNGKFEYHQRVYKFSSFRHITGKFFFHYIKSSLRFEALDASAKSTVDSLRLPLLHNFPTVLPPTAEQEEIVKWIESESFPVDSAIARTEREIALMQEYRTRLTADIVTGKLDVRDAAAKLPDTKELGPTDEEVSMDDDDEEVNESN